MTQFDPIFSALQKTGVRYVVVGGVPVQLSDFADPTIREGWIRDKGMMVFQMYSDQTGF